MRILDNISEITRDDLVETIKKGSKVSVVADMFSIYAYKELESKLKGVSNFQFVFSQPDFITEEETSESREFSIEHREQGASLFGTRYEIKLRNEMMQKAISRECADWIRQRATFKANITGQTMPGFLTVDNNHEEIVYAPMEGFTTADIGCESDYYLYNLTQRIEGPYASKYLQVFDTIWNDKNMATDVTDTVLEKLSIGYKENSPEFIYYLTLFHLFGQSMDNDLEDVPIEGTGLKQSKIWNMLYDFQKDAALAIIGKIEKYNGCILADSVGLGKTFTALAVIKYYENRNKSVLVLCPKKLGGNWNLYNHNDRDNPLATDRLRYEVLFHTDLSRDSGFSNGRNLEEVNWGNYDLVVIDESHHFRSGTGSRYEKLKENVIRAGVKTKVLMLSATPVNTRFIDLNKQLEIACKSSGDDFDRKLNIRRPVDEIFRQAQKTFNAWSRLELNKRTTDELMRRMDSDFFEVLDSVTIARSRKHVERYYSTAKIGKFPQRLKPISLRPGITSLKKDTSYNKLYDQLMRLSLRIYTPSDYILPNKKDKYRKLKNSKGQTLTQEGREAGIRRLMSINLLKRLESSVYSFSRTIERIQEYILDTIRAIDSFEKTGISEIYAYEANEDEFDIEDANTDYLTVGKKIKINLADMDYKKWRTALKQDSGVMKQILLMVRDVTPEYDTKLQTLLDVISQKIEHPINKDNRKVLIFSAFSDTAEYLYDNVSVYIKEKYELETALITGTGDGKSTLPGKKFPIYRLLTYFSPLSKNTPNQDGKERYSIDILIATDCISEGQNLQDCDYCINYDIHWNPVRIIQRFGRIDRIGSKNEYIQLVNFWPDMDLDDYINLKSRVETRMKASIMVATGDDDPINDEEKGDLTYRRNQLKKLQEEVVDIEEMSEGISITDLGLTEYRMEIQEYIKKHPDLRRKPNGLHTVAPATEEMPEGVIFILYNEDKKLNLDHRNRIYPYYMVYVGRNGEIVYDFMKPKQILDSIRFLCKGKPKPVKEAYTKFNEETSDGNDMEGITELLNLAVDSIIEAGDKKDVESLFQSGSAVLVSGEEPTSDDFELVTFVVVR